MNNQEWTKKRMESYASVGELCAAINAALTAERERYGALELEHDRMAGYAMESVSKLEAAVSEIQQLREQLVAEREKAYNKGRADSGKMYDMAMRDNRRLDRELAAEREKLDHEIMCHAACGVIAMSNTRESLAKNRVMKPEYLSASVQDCIRMAEREIELRSQLAAAVEVMREIDQAGAYYRAHRIKLIDALVKIGEK